MPPMQPLRCSATLFLLLFPLCLAAMPPDDSQPDDSQSGDGPALALLGLDPLALIAGEELEGRPDLSLDFGGLRYHFITDGNRQRFLKDPARYAIQLDGACAAMPGSTGANPEIFRVYAGRIYIFGSTTCREHFDERPEHYLDEHETAGRETSS